jgi:hypothetical protein
MAKRFHFFSFWCRFAHNAPMWPRTDGSYECGICHQLHPVPWSKKAEVEQTVPLASGTELIESTVGGK